MLHSYIFLYKYNIVDFKNFIQLPAEQASSHVRYCAGSHPFFIFLEPSKHSQYPESVLEIDSRHPLSRVGSLGPSTEQPPVCRHIEQTIVQWKY